MNNIYITSSIKIRVLLIVVLLFGISCTTSRLSEHFDYNEFNKDKVFNSSLKISFGTSNKDNYTTSKRKVNKIIKQSNIDFKNNILLYSKTENSTYEYFVTIGSDSLEPSNENIFILDTTINSQILRFIGKPLERTSFRNLRKDLTHIYNNFEIENRSK